MEGEGQAPVHVLIFPLPVQGHVNSMLKLAELLAFAGLHVTFLNTDYNQDLLVRHTNILDRFTCFPGFQFKTISDGLPTEHPRSGEEVMDLFDSLKSVTKPQFRDMLFSGQFTSASSRIPVTCIIADGILSFPIDDGSELGIPVIHFRTISASCFWAYFSVPDMIEAGELPIRGNEDMDRLIASVPGMETFLRCRDLPSFCRVSDLADPNLKLIAHETRQSLRAHALILNTFEDLEGPVLSQVRTQFPNIYTIGPLHALLKSKLGSKRATLQSESSNSLFKVDKSCMTWLDAQPAKSVIYVSFGSITKLTKDVFMEFWHGLVNSKKRFLWVIRPGMVEGKDGEGHIPVELGEATKERGYMVSWAPQEEVLGHPAVGGFLTHGGWNSILESIEAGVPMIFWPYFGDQQVNSRFVSEVLKLGLDMKDVHDRVIVERMVNDLMEEKRENFMKSMVEMSRLAKESVRECGSSYCNLDRLIEDIRLMSMGGK